jgi:hypothetical protein
MCVDRRAGNHVCPPALCHQDLSKSYSYFPFLGLGAAGGDFGLERLGFEVIRTEPTLFEVLCDFEGAGRLFCCFFAAGLERLLLFVFIAISFFWILSFLGCDNC